MIRTYQDKDKENVNKLLKNTNYQIEKDTFIINPYRNYIILEIDKIKGILIYDKIYERFEIIYIYVEKEERRKGYGNALMDYFIELVKKQKGENITLEVDEKNKNAIKLYKKHEFEKVSIREKYYQNSNGYLMIRKT